MLSERSSVYNILISLMESKEEGEFHSSGRNDLLLIRQLWDVYIPPCVFLLGAELKGLGSDLAFGFVQAVDGERDPRNLLLAFRIARNIIHRGYELSQYSTHTHTHTVE